MTQLATMDEIDRRLDRAVADAVPVNPKKGLVIESLGQAMELAKMMSFSGTAVPAYLRKNPGACLAIAIQGYEWGINPFALANKSYVVNDRLGYEASLYHAVVQRRAPIDGRIKSKYSGQGATRKCTVWAILDDGSDETVEYTSPEIGTIRVQNSPLWKSDPDQQLFYFSVRAFARRHFPDVMMGIYTVDELVDSPIDAVNGQAQEGPTRAAPSLKERMKVTNRPLSEGHTLADSETGELLQEGEAAPVSPAEQLEPGPSESDVAGTDAQPPEDPAPPPMTPREQFMIQVHEAAVESGITDAVRINTAIQTWAIACKPPVKGKEDKATQEQKDALYTAMKERRGVWAFAQ